MTSRASTKSILVLIHILTLLFCLFVAFYNLNSPSIRVSDENAHIRAAQSILEGAEVWRPLFNSKYYINKPPFKIALSTIPVKLLGQSNLNFRLIDALCGLGTGLLIYALLKSLTSTSIPGIFAVILLFTSQSFVFNHGIRHGVQDSMLVFLTTAFLYIFYSYLQKERQLLSASILCGFLGGLAILTKSAGGLIGPIICLPYLCFLHYRERQHPPLLKPLIISGCIMSFMALLYYVPLFLYTPGAYEAIVGEQVSSRMSADMGYGTAPLFYLNRLLFDRIAVAPELLFPSLCALFIVRRRSPDASFFVFWACIPVCLFSLFSTRYTWYINPALPGMACCVALAAWKLWQEVSIKAIKQLVFILCVISTTVQAKSLTSKILSAPERLPIDLLSEHILNTDNPQQTVLWVKPQTMEFALHELPYLSMLKPYLKKSGTIRGAKKKIKTKTPDFALVSLEDLPKLLKEKEPKAYLLLPPLFNREQRVAMLSYKDAPYPLFHSFRRNLLEEFVYHSRTSPELTKELPLTLHTEGDYLGYSYPQKLELTLRCHEAATIPPVSVTLQSQTLPAHWTKEGSNYTATFTIEKNEWLPEATAFQVKTSGCSHASVLSFSVTPLLEP